MNEWYAKDTSNKIKSIFLSRMSDGKRCSGSISYGYNRLPEDKQTLVVDPVASQVVKHIFELAAEGLTPPAIARQLTEEKVLIHRRTPSISPRTMQPKSGVRLHKLERKHGKRDFKPTGISRSYCAEKDHRNEL